MKRAKPALRWLPDRILEALLPLKKPEVVSEIKGIESRTGAKTEGWFVGCPLTPRLMLHGLELERVYDVIVECCRIADSLGADIVGLGAFTSVVGDGGLTINHRSPIPVTTGNSYTIATAIEGTLKAAEMVGIVPEQSTLAVVGATGSIGKTCARIMAPRFERTLLVGRDRERTENLAHELPRAIPSTDPSVLVDADAVITVTSSDTEVIEAEHLKPGAVVCDVARPRDVSRRVAERRPDVLVIEGGVVSVPGPVDFGFDFGFPPRTAYACMSETMILALEERSEPFTIGKEVSVERVSEIARLARKHGFELSGFRSFERAVTPDVIERVRLARKSETRFSAESR